jgi:hypothetical protein
LKTVHNCIILYYYHILYIIYYIIIQLFKHEKINLVRGPIDHPRVLISSQFSQSEAIYFIENSSKLHSLILSHIIYHILIQLFDDEKINLVRGPIAHPRVLISSQSSRSEAIYFIENSSKLHLLILSHIIYHILIQLFDNEKINLIRGQYFTPAGTDQIEIWPVRSNLFH